MPKGKPQHGWRKGRESPGARQLGGPLPCPPIPQRPSMTVLPAWPCLSHTSRCPWLPEQEPLPCSSSVTGVLTSPQRNIWVPHHPMCTPLFTDFRKRDRSRGRKEGKRDRQTDVDLLFPLHIHWLLLIWTLTRDRTCNPGVSGRCSNELSYPGSTSVHP